MNEYLKINEEYIAFCKTLFYFNIFSFYLKDFISRIHNEISYIYIKCLFLFFGLIFKYSPQKTNTSYQHNESTMKGNYTIPLEIA